MSRDDALRLADEKELDLVEISPNVSPPVCKIMDYDKYRFEQNKKAKLTKKKQKAGILKEIWVTPQTEKHDYEVKLKQVINFLEHGCKVKIAVKFRGRQILYKEFGIKLLENFQKDIETKGFVEIKPKFEGKNLVMLISPK